VKSIRNALSLLALLPVLAACGATEDFAVQSDRSAAQIVSGIAYFDFAAEASYLPNLAIITERPSEREIVYTIPAREIPNKQTGQSTIRLTIEPGADGKGSMIHAVVDVPQVRVLMGEAGKALSEQKVEAELNKALTAFNPGKVRELLVAIAIASNIDYQSLANTAQLPAGAASNAFDPEGDGEAAFDDGGWGQ
jgi:hypothetical protein